MLRGRVGAIFNGWRLVTAAMCSNGVGRPSAAIIVIGDEILKGQTQDSNSHFICKRLYNRGILVREISIIGDNVDEIAKKVVAFSAEFDFVLTCGGIGSTHDDKTFEGVALAFNEELTQHPELTALVQTYFVKRNTNDRESALKLAQIPNSSQLLWGVHRRSGQRSLYPIVRVRNVHIFPGIPQYCEKLFDELEDKLFSNYSQNLFRDQIYLNIDEVTIAAQIKRVADQYASDHVCIGSYPVVDNSFYKTRVTIDSADVDKGSSAYDDLCSALKDYVIKYDSNPCVDIVDKFVAYKQSLSTTDDDDYRNKLETALKLIDDIFDQYPLNSICLSFNGGKDCTVLLHLIQIKLIEKFGKDARLAIVHVRSRLPYTEIESFIRDTIKRYNNLELIEFDGPIKSALVNLKSHRPNIIPIFIGSRSTDNTTTTSLAWTDPDWPRYLRVSPLVHWRYADIWRFLRDLSIPYCILYDRGFTSIGDRERTRPNAALRYTDAGGIERYLPAYTLVDETLERAGRQ